MPAPGGHHHISAVGKLCPATTVVATKAIHLEEKIDAVKAGQLANLGAVEGDPMKEINGVREVKLIMNGGTLFKRP